MGYIFLLAIIFIIIAIMRNKNEEYAKQISFTILIFSILNCFILQRASGYGNGAAFYFGHQMSGDKMDFIFNLSIIMALISLIVYLFADADR